LKGWPSVLHLPVERAVHEEENFLASRFEPSRIGVTRWPVAPGRAWVRGYSLNFLTPLNEDSENDAQVLH